MFPLHSVGFSVSRADFSINRLYHIRHSREVENRKISEKNAVLSDDSRQEIKSDFSFLTTAL
jgi:hypothetical protein